jgi:arylformamidase
MNEKVFLHYTQAELDRNYDQRGWVKNAEEIIARYPVCSAETRRKLVHRKNIAYGPDVDEVLDIFSTAVAGAPTLIFIHGGAWRNFTKDDHSFVAGALVPAGIHVVVVNFSKIPKVRLPDAVMQARRSIAWVCHHAREFGGTSDKVYVCGHSSGAHMTAMATLTDWSAFDLPPDAIKGAACISGSYDLEPVLLSARSAYIKLNQQEQIDLSPARHALRIPCPIFVAYAERDTDEFQRHSREFAAALEKSNMQSHVAQLPNVNHFEIIELLADPQSALFCSVLQHIEKTTKQSGEAAEFLKTTPAQDRSRD